MAHSPSSQSTNVAADIPRQSEKPLDPIFTKDFGILPIPAWLRSDPEKPFHFGIVLNGAFAFASTFTAANIYYCQPLLVQLANDFGVTYDRVSEIPTLVQAGYAIGLFFITPLGDLVRRRPLILLVASATTALTIGIALAQDVITFEVISFLVGVMTVTPQILIPLAADLAPPSQRATAIAVVLSGLLLGVLIARVLAGIIAEFSYWRAVYYFAVGVQALLVGVLYLVLPDYPAKNQGISYFGIIWSMCKYAVTEPLLVQACLIVMATSACFTSFWVTLTFLLDGPPYNYSTLVIGLFGIVGIVGVVISPFAGRVIDKFVPWYAALLSILAQTIFQAVQVGAGGVHVAAVVVVALGLDVFRQTLQVSLTSAVLSISIAARARLNAVLILSFFIGQVIGTAAGSKVFLEYGWRASAALSLGWFGFQLVIISLRGPHVPLNTWFGYKGGMRPLLVAHLFDQDTKKETMEVNSQPTEDKNGSFIRTNNA